MVIANGKVFKDNAGFDECNVFVSGEKIDRLSEDSAADNEDFLDASGCFVIPGLIDLHFHGAVGEDVCDGTIEGLKRISEYELKNGITSICPAMMTLPEDELIKDIEVGKTFRDGEGKDFSCFAQLLGFNMEGPFISPVKKGAQNEEYIKKADAELAEKFIEAGDGLVKIIGLAPEESPNYESYIDAVKDKVIISLAHTDSDYETAMNAIKHGASHVVHLYNAMTGLTHRAPGVVGAAFDSKKVTCEIICDGIHIAPAAVRIAFNEAGADRMILISDSMRATGLEDGIYSLGGLDVEKKGSLCTLKGTDTIAGSATNLFDCMVNCHKNMGIALEVAIGAATYNPAKVLGVSDNLGSISEGKQADLLVLDKDLKLIHVIKKGKLIY
ncbi:MAG: N-acetylglucosamine-6-phosphate deacetylase [Butyrivibrio sp.]|uniref:N-acetylglucosamine-6-phosphate deacetylase n=1 Tax=Butyrivibrio sp. TaxID=28121 RepID=UPI001B10E57B|nr:N-acetylglucosamine-6-phosphate deacetylase [Butyrivibrio sp.]MBO6242360.1 N-acetylglucosamine-6-phosphate deacetylase [Butyrivibrio sp.]